MVPTVAAEKIEHLLVSTTETGIQDHTSLLESYKEFNNAIVEAGIQKPVVLLSDGHTSRFDESVLQFLDDEEIRLFIGPPDTTGVTQLLDQINQSLHTEYRAMKGELFTQFSKINREGFMTILSELWGTWTSPEKIVNAARRVGITNTGLDVSHMQQSKFEQARLLIEDADTEELPLASSSFTSMTETPSPQQVRKGSARYYKEKLNSLQGKLANFLQDAEINLEEVPGFYEKNKIRPSKQSNDKTTRITQLSGSMTAKKAIEKVKEIKEKKKEADSKRARAKDDKAKQFEMFVRCREECICKSKVCQAKGLKQCPVCKNVMKSNCSKAKCKTDGKNPSMILPAKSARVAAKKKLLSHFDESSEDELSGEDESGDETEGEEIHFTKMG